MSAILLALGSALGYGAADFIAGWVSRRSHYARVSLLAQLAAATGTLTASLVVGGRPSGVSDLNHVGVRNPSGIRRRAKCACLLGHTPAGRSTVMPPLQGAP